MVTVFWHAQGILLIEFRTRGTIINSEVYCRMLQNLKRADDARPHTVVRTEEILRKFKGDVFQHSPYNPDLAPSDYHLFAAIKKWLGRQHFADDEDLKNIKLLKLELPLW